MAVAFSRKASLLSSTFLFFTALLVAFDVAAADDARACDDVIVNIVNQTDIDFYMTCPAIDSVLFFVDHEFKGPFELPGVESLPKFSSGYLGPELQGMTRVEDGVTTISMPDLQNTTSGGMLFGYLNDLTSISFPKLETVSGDIVVIGSDGVRNVTLPALSTIGGGVLLDGDFDEINLSSLKSVAYMRVESTGNISCPALGAAFASLTFTGTEDDIYQGFTCWTPDENNTWNSSDPSNNPTTGDSSPTATNSGSASATSSKTSTASVAQIRYTVIILLFAAGMLYL
ncbi:hypothetical protein N8I77_010962 [Diaporthe amygdali]|uniref:Uncharacterized protein n=1 Tax=Phomopsis amygdali TaxID=1214568 RepID=A0AAD9S851_PHOAM|nr:hypothetical protein N8I77_010962 [Diaporthe amygdali]